MLRIIFIFLGLLLGFDASHAQTMEGDLEMHLNEYIDNLPGNSGDDYEEASPEDLQTWEEMMTALSILELMEARAKAAELNYQIVEYTDTGVSNEEYYVVEEKVPSQKYWGTYVFNKMYCRFSLVLQAPHPRYDTNTGKEAVFCFLRLSAHALFISGTHRCNHDNFSSCSGTTSACGSSEAYRVSDMAHGTDNAFHRSTKVWSETHPETHFVQLHGFAKQTDDPYLILSNGTRETPDLDHLTEIASKLNQIDEVLDAEIAHLNLSWTRLIAFTNTQGRMLNESTDPCNKHNPSTTGRFLHIEQEKSRLRADSTGWDKMRQALGFSFPCVSLPTEEPIKNQFKVFPNPNLDGTLSIAGENIDVVKIYDLLGQEQLRFNKFPFGGTLDISRLGKGIYILTIDSGALLESHRLIIGE